ncbi:coiled-coil domain-containing protein 106-like [Labeo rohita]|uniref:Coiled-coil domain-containing protein 106-like n=1 Tax=Labeo rohita TaxID=84645 RepID=A0A498NL70_LABRO|nr:coiled-coil domain-containing protein 106-like [Labeo rohita]
MSKKQYFPYSINTSPCNIIKKGCSLGFKVAGFSGVFMVFLIVWLNNIPIEKTRHPEEVIKRYRKVLKAYKKGRKLSVAYRKVGVDRNTIVANAPICELAVVAPKKYKELLVAHTPQQRLQDFAKKCLEVLINDPKLLRDVEHQKKKGKLIPLSTKA